MDKGAKPDKLSAAKPPSAEAIPERQVADIGAEVELDVKVAARNLATRLANFLSEIKSPNLRERLEFSLRAIREDPQRFAENLALFVNCPSTDFYVSSDILKDVRSGRQNLDEELAARKWNRYVEEATRARESVIYKNDAAVISKINAEIGDEVRRMMDKLILRNENINTR